MVILYEIADISSQIAIDSNTCVTVALASLQLRSVVSSALSNMSLCKSTVLKILVGIYGFVISFDISFKYVVLHKYKSGGHFDEPERRERNMFPGNEQCRPD